MDFGLARAWQSHVLTWITFVMLMVTVVISAYFLYQTTRLMRVMELLNHPLPIVNVGAEIDRGQPLVYRMNYCKHVEAFATTTRELVAVDGRQLIVMLPLTASTLPAGCHSYLLVDDIPSYVPPGKYKLRMTRLYNVRTLYDTPQVIETEVFAVR